MRSGLAVAKAINPESEEEDLMGALRYVLKNCLKKKPHAKRPVLLMLQRSLCHNLLDFRSL